MEEFLEEKFETLKIEIDQSWVTIWLNRPKSKNSLSTKMSAELFLVLNSIAEVKKIRGVALRGVKNCFCAGADLKEFKDNFLDKNKSRSDIIKISEDLALLLKRLYSMPQITVALVEGPALAGGLGLACCTDFVFATEESFFSLSETRIGLSPAQISPYVIERIGKRRARHLMLKGERLTAEDAASYGLVDETLENSKKLSEFFEIFKDSCNTVGPAAVAITKQVISDSDRVIPSKRTNYLAKKFADCMISEEGKEGILAFSQKRNPKWAAK